MSEQTDQQLAVREQDDLPTVFSFEPRDWDEAMRICEALAKSDLVPRDYKGKPGNVLVAWMKGKELGLQLLSALATISVINGRATIWGDGMRALVMAHKDYEWDDESECTDEVGVCTVKRKGHPPYTQRFSLADAKRAGLLNKEGPWQTYTRRQLQMRARGFAFRDKFADALMGLILAEEALDIPPEHDAPKGETPDLRTRLQAKVQPKADADDAIIPKKEPEPDKPQETTVEGSEPDLFMASHEKAQNSMVRHMATEKALRDAADDLRKADEPKPVKPLAPGRPYGATVPEVVGLIATLRRTVVGTRTLPGIYRGLGIPEDDIPEDLLLLDKLRDALKVAVDSQAAKP